MPPDEPRRWRSFGGGALFWGDAPGWYEDGPLALTSRHGSAPRPVPESQRDYGLQPKVAELARLPWVTIRKWIQPQRGCGKGRARVKRSRHGRNRVAVGNDLRTVSQGSSCLATLGFGTESRWDSPRAEAAKAGPGRAKAGGPGGRGSRRQCGFVSLAPRGDEPGLNRPKRG